MFIRITEALKAAEGKLTKISPFTEDPPRDDMRASDKERVEKLSKLTGRMDS